MGKAIICNLGQSRSFGRLSLKAKVLWPMLLVACDDQGRGDAAADAVKWYICPNVDEITQSDIPSIFAEMEEQRMILVYDDDDGEPIFQIVKWWDYQKPQWAKPSKYPAPENWVDRVRSNVRGGDYVEEHWEHPGGFAPQEEGENPPGNPPGKKGGPTKEKKRKEVEVEEKEKEEEERNHHNCFSLYEQAGGVLTKITADQLADLVDEYEDHRQGLPPPSQGHKRTGDEWVQAAIEEAARANARISVNYITAILDRWKRDGFEARRKRKSEAVTEEDRMRYREWAP